MRGEDLLEEQTAAMAELERSSTPVLFGALDRDDEAEAGDVAKAKSESRPRPESKCA